jgi:hypothetical protein
MDWLREHVDETTPEGKLALAYTSAMAELTVIAGQLTDRCARCHIGHVGCCDTNTRHTMGMPEHLLRLQELEAGRSGWTMPTDDRMHRCQFHGDRGCVLTVTRSTICYAFFCKWIIEEMCQTDGAELVMPFIEASTAFYEGPSLIGDPDATLANIQRAIEAGRVLLAHRHKHGARQPIRDDSGGRVRLRVLG